MVPDLFFSKNLFEGETEIRENSNQHGGPLGSSGLEAGFVYITTGGGTMLGGTAKMRPGRLPV